MMKSIYHNCYLLIILILLVQCKSQNNQNHTNSIPIPGSINHFDPLANLEYAAKFAGENAKLISIEAKSVSTNGLVDLEEENNPFVLYSFEVQVENEKKEEIVQPSVIIVTVRKPSVAQVESYSADKVTQTTRKDLGMSKDETDMKMYDALATPPKCSFKSLWEVALEAGIPDSLKADINYDASGYEFSIDGTANWISFYKDCDIKYQIINGIFEK